MSSSVSIKFLVNINNKFTKTKKTLHRLIKFNTYYCSCICYEYFKKLVLKKYNEFMSLGKSVIVIYNSLLKSNEYPQKTIDKLVGTVKKTMEDYTILINGYYFQ